MKHFTLGRLLLVGFVFQCIAVSAASAQTSAGGLFRPWPKAQDYDFSLGATFQNTATTDVGNFDIQLNEYTAIGRIRFSEEHELNPTIGFEFDYLDIGNNAPNLPGALSDQSIGFGTPLGKWGDDWFAAVSGAFGYAGSSTFGVSEAWYAKATVIVGKKMNNGDLLVFGLDYDGNRSFMPDTPLPGFAYTHRVDEKLLLAAGFPYTSIEWDPIQDLKFNLYFNLPDVFIARLSYNFVKELGVFVGYEDRIQPFSISGLANDDDRLFYVSHRVEGGIRIDPHPAVTIRASIGYNFGQEFNTGWDSRNLDSVTDLSDEMYGRIAVDLRY